MSLCIQRIFDDKVWCHLTYDSKSLTTYLADLYDFAFIHGPLPDWINPFGLMSTFGKYIILFIVPFLIWTLLLLWIRREKKVKLFLSSIIRRWLRGDMKAFIMDSLITREDNCNYTKKIMLHSPWFNTNFKIVQNALSLNYSFWYDYITYILF